MPNCLTAAVLCQISRGQCQNRGQHKMPYPTSSNIIQLRPTLFNPHSIPIPFPLTNRRAQSRSHININRKEPECRPVNKISRPREKIFRQSAIHVSRLNFSRTREKIFAHFFLPDSRLINSEKFEIFRGKIFLAFRVTRA